MRSELDIGGVTYWLNVSNVPCSATNLRVSSHVLICSTVMWNRRLTPLSASRCMRWKPTSCSRGTTARLWLWQATYTCTTCKDTACRLVMAGYVHLYNLQGYSMQTGYGRLRTPVPPVRIQHADWLWQATYTCTTCRDTACRLVMAGYVHLYNL